MRFGHLTYDPWIWLKITSLSSTVSVLNDGRISLDIPSFCSEIFFFKTSNFFFENIFTLGTFKLFFAKKISHPFSWRLWRPWMLLSTKSKGHKSNVRISWMYRSCFYDLKMHFWWPNKCLKYIISSWNTLYYCFLFSFFIVSYWLKCPILLGLQLNSCTDIHPDVSCFLHEMCVLFIICH